jgi:hypothetical protein
MAELAPGATFMNENIFLEIEETFSQLPVPEQLRLVARLVLRIRDRTGGDRNDLDAKLSQMVVEPPGKVEPRNIEKEPLDATLARGAESKLP